MGYLVIVGITFVVKIYIKYDHQKHIKNCILKKTKKQKQMPFVNEKK